MQRHFFFHRFPLLLSESSCFLELNVSVFYEMPILFSGTYFSAFNSSVVKGKGSSVGGSCAPGTCSPSLGSQRVKVGRGLRHLPPSPRYCYLRKFKLCALKTDKPIPKGAIRRI